MDILGTTHPELPGSVRTTSTDNSDKEKKQRQQKPGHKLNKSSSFMDIMERKQKVPPFDLQADVRNVQSWFASKAAALHLKIQTLTEQEMLILGGILYIIGLAGLVVSLFGFFAAIFIGVILSSIGIILFVQAKRIRRSGLLSYAPGPIQRLMTKW
jgi:hypothetical protein